ncbi:MAG: MSMEG_1061 family FMN-dependent PPOX-type flavoprotein [Bryobacteraceae bacterium]
MEEYVFENVVTSAETLAELLGRPSELAVRKEKQALDAHMRAFIEASPIALVGTASRDGRCDVSPRGDAPGFVKILDDRTLAIPDRPGNKRFDTMRNILDTGHLGALFLIPGRTDGLRVNGRGRIVRDDGVLAMLEAQGKRPVLAIALTVEECFLHCSKALMRSKLWEGTPAPPIASFAEMIHDQTRLEGMTLEAMERRLAEAHKTLY